MNFSISTLLCWALILAHTTAAQSSQRNSGFSFKDADADIEGSGFDGELNRDLESSGSGLGPTDDEDVVGPDINPMPKQETNIPKQVSPQLNNETPDKNNDKVEVNPTQDTAVIMNPKSEDRPTSFFSQPGILAAVIGGAVVGLLCAILVVMFIVYRMRKKDEGSYALGEPKQSPNSNSYSRGTSKEFYA